MWRCGGVFWYTAGMAYKVWRSSRPSRMIELYGDYERDLHDGRVGYNFTIRVVAGVPPLSRIVKEESEPVLTPLGDAVLKKISEVLPREIWLRCAILMPDHLHLCLWVKAPLRVTILQVLTKALLFSEKMARENYGQDALWQRPGHLFQCYSLEVLEQKMAYNRGNVARWKMDHAERGRSHPHPVVHCRLTSAYAWEGYGEIELLDSAHFLPCYISHRATDEAVGHFANLAIQLSNAGWTLVGGFVSERERALLRRIRTATSPRVIHLAAARLEDGKVPAKLAEELYRGRFLRLTSAEVRESCTREICVWHNLWAETLCGDWRSAIEAHFQTVQNVSGAQSAYIHNFLAQWPSPDPTKNGHFRPLP